jgi:hypothetical protein
MTASGGVDIPFASADFNVTAEYDDSKTTSTGCEQVAVAAKQYLSASKKVACILNENVTTSSKTLNAGNSIIFRTQTGDITFEGPLTINQSIEIVMIDLAQLSSQAKMNIADEVKQTALQIADAIQESDSGMGATPQGSKTVSEQKSEITTENINNIVEKVINEVTITLNASNDILIETVSGNIKLGETTIDQNILLNLTATLITTNSIDTVLKSLATSVSIQESKARQIAENLGADTLGGQAGDAAAAMIKARGEARGGIMQMIGGIIVLSVGAFLFFKIKGSVSAQVPQALETINKIPLPSAATLKFLPPQIQAGVAAARVVQAMTPPGSPADSAPAKPHDGFSGVQNGRRILRSPDGGINSSTTMSIFGFIFGASICVGGILGAIYYFTYDNRYTEDLRKADKAFDKCMVRVDKACPFPSCTGEICPTPEDKRKVSACVEQETKGGCPDAKMYDYVSPVSMQMASLVSIGIGLIIIIQSVW